MKRNILQKMLAIFSALLLLLISCVSVSALGTTQKLVSVLSGVSRDVLIPALPFVSSNSGLDMLDEALSKHQNGQDAGILGSAIEMALQHTDAGTLQNMIDSMRLLDEGFRQTCQEIYQNREGLSLSAAESRGVEILIQEADQAGLQAALNSHQISKGMIAKFLQAATLLNNGEAFLGMDREGAFFVKSFPTALLESLEAIWQADGMDFSLTQQISEGVTSLNSVLTASERNSVGLLFYKAGLLDSAPSYSPPTQEVEKLPGASSGSYEKTDSEKENTGADLTFNVTEDGLISVAGTYENPVVYRVEGTKLIPVTMALYIDGAIVAELSKGQYAVKEVSPYFSDCSGWSKPYIEALYARGIVGGKAEGIFAPEDSITREEFVKLIIELFDMKDDNATTTFVDVPADAWYYSYVASAQQYGIVNGVSSTEFGVGEKIKRQDMAKIISQILTQKGLSAVPADPSAFGDYASIAPYAQPHVLAVCGLDIVSGDDKGNFNPAQSATRGEAAKMIYGVLKAVLLRGK
ncbi:MAG: S-layer homology domain-containing protein [Clostridia bacterium]|nr:S-layer homology domain-containing protein [Clostridia bacterium]